MAKTTMGTNDALCKKLFNEKLYRDMIKESFFSKFMGKGSNSICEMKTDLEKSRGDKITFGIRMRLEGAGVTSGQTLEGNEEKLVDHDFSLTLEEYAHAVRLKGPLDIKRAVYDMKSEARQAIQDWGTEKIDQLCFDAAYASPNIMFYPVSGVFTKSTSTPLATGKAAITATDKLTPAFLTKLSTWAKSGGSRSQTPLRPIRINGRKYFVLLTHHDGVNDLWNDATIQQAHREAMQRGSDNPLFKEADIIWKNIIVFGHENCVIGTDAGSGSNVPYVRSLFMGAQALAFAWGMRPDIIAEKFDYNREHGYAFDMISAQARPVFNSKDYGCLNVISARTQVSDA